MLRHDNILGFIAADIRGKKMITRGGADLIKSTKSSKALIVQTTVSIQVSSTKCSIFSVFYQII